MKCAWNELMSVLPAWLRPQADKQGKQDMEALRLRINGPPEWTSRGVSYYLPGQVSQEDISFVINHASRFSPWVSESLSKGYLTAPGGHRIGLCGEAVYQDGLLTGLREITSVCIRVARDYPDLGKEILQTTGNAVILGAPGWGKTTLLRSMIRHLGQITQIAVVDERGEIFPRGLNRGRGIDVLTGADKTKGIDMVMRSMGPAWIAVDEITAPADCDGLINAHGCGVSLLATAHASSMNDFYNRGIYRRLIQEKVFQWAILLREDKTYQMERILK